MSQTDNILQELKDLQSRLAESGRQNAYQVPARYFEDLPDQVLRHIRALKAASATNEIEVLSPVIGRAGVATTYVVPTGYFDGLAAEVLKRVKALEAPGVTEELYQLSPLLAGISKEMPYTLPSAYFDDLAETAAIVASTADAPAREELSALSPLLSGLKKDMPYSVPETYFAGFPASPKGEEKAKLISFSRRKWFRIAAAAMVIGIISVSAFFFVNRKGSTIDGTSQEQVHGLVKNISTEDIDQFVKTVDQDAPVIAMAQIKKEKDEIKDLVKDIPDDELQKFLDETKNATDDASIDELFAN